MLFSLEKNPQAWLQSDELGSLSERPLMLLCSPHPSILGHQFMLQRSLVRRRSSQSPALMSQVPLRNNSDL